MIIISLAVGKP